MLEDLVVGDCPTDHGRHPRACTKPSSAKDPAARP
jgi:hypothetical protein